MELLPESIERRQSIRKIEGFLYKEQVCATIGNTRYHINAIGQGISMNVPLQSALPYIPFYWWFMWEINRWKIKKNERQCRRICLYGFTKPKVTVLVGGCEYVLNNKGNGACLSRELDFLPFHWWYMKKYKPMENRRSELREYELTDDVIPPFTPYIRLIIGKDFINIDGCGLAWNIAIRPLQEDSITFHWWFMKNYFKPKENRMVMVSKFTIPTSTPNRRIFIGNDYIYIDGCGLAWNTAIRVSKWDSITFHW